MYQQDKRVVKTKKNIRETFLTLLGEMPFEKITVTQIASQALIGKTTFYLHYNDKYELAEECIRDFLQTIEDGVRKQCLSAGSENSYLTELAGFLGSLTDQILLLNRISFNSFYLYDKIRDTLCAVLKDIFRADGVSENKIDMQAYQAASSMIDFLRYKCGINPGVSHTDYIRNLSEVIGRPRSQGCRS